MLNSIDFVIDGGKTSSLDVMRFTKMKGNGGTAYIASPYSGDVESNVKFARRCCRWVYENTEFIPIAPHLLFPQFLDDDSVRERFAVTMWNERLLDDADVLLVFGDEITSGMKEEIEYFTEENLCPTIVYLKENKNNNTSITWSAQ